MSDELTFLTVEHLLPDSRRSNGASDLAASGPPPDETASTGAAVWATVASPSFA